MKRKITKIGTSVGVIIPSILAKSLNLQVGSEIEISEGPNNTIIIKPVIKRRQGWAEAFEQYAKNNKY